MCQIGWGTRCKFGAYYHDRERIKRWPDKSTVMARQPDVVLVRYGEIFLKGPQVREGLESLLASQISRCLERVGITHKVKRMRGRMVVKTPDPRGACEAVRNIFGIVSVSPSFTVEKALADIAACAVEIARASIAEGETFAIDANRADKTFPLTSQDINSTVGESVRVATDATVDLGDPDLTIGIDIRDDAYLYIEVVDGPGGLPLGTSGRGLCLFSGGIDSPVACYLMMKRGCEQELLYFDNQPFADSTTLDRAVSVARRLRAHSCSSHIKMLVAPHGHSLEDITRQAPRGLTCTLCKRMMVRVADAVASERGLDVIINGSSLSQVCSQTMPNLKLTILASRTPVLMPLISFDKEEIVAISRRIGTFDASIAPATECSAVPDQPRTKPTLAEVIDAESKIDVNGLVGTTLDGIREIEL